MKYVIGTFEDFFQVSAINQSIRGSLGKILQSRGKSTDVQLQTLFELYSHHYLRRILILQGPFLMCGVGGPVG